MHEAIAELSSHWTLMLDFLLLMWSACGDCGLPCGRMMVSRQPQ